MALVQLYAITCDPCGAFCVESLKPTPAEARHAAEAAGWRRQRRRRIRTCPTCKTLVDEAAGGLTAILTTTGR